MSGWFKLNRALFDHWIAHDNDHLSVWVRMLSEANFEEKSKIFNGSLVTVGRGQIIFGLQAWSEKTGVTVSKLRRLISKLERDSVISRQTFNKFSLISIVNYELYQSGDSQDGRQTTGKRQANDRQTTTPKELKNIRTKEDKNTVDSGESPAADNAYIEKMFDIFWKHYQVKQGKQTAKKKFMQLLKGKTEFMARYAKDMILSYYMHCLESNILGFDKLHPTTYLNQKRWTDDPEFIKEFKLQWLKDNANG